MSLISSLTSKLAPANFRQVVGDARIWIVVTIICGTWIALSQIQVIPSGKYVKLLGADGVLTFLENKTVEWRLKFRGPIECPEKIIYVNVDTEAIREFGNVPWSRAIFAAALDALFTHGKVKAVGMDFVFSEQGLSNLGQEEAREGSRALATSIHSHPNVVLGATYGSNIGVQGLKRPFPLVIDLNAAQDIDTPELPQNGLIGPSWGRIGLIDTFLHDQWIPMFSQFRQVNYLPLSLQLALIHWDLSPSALTIERDEVVVRKPDGSIQQNIPLWLHQLTEINWFSSWEENATCSIRSVIAASQRLTDGDDDEKKEAADFFAEFHHALVLIGPTDPLLHDTTTTPTNPEIPVPKVSAHGNMLKTILTGKFLHRPPVWVNIFIILTFGLATTAVCLRQGSVWRYLAVGFVGLYILAAFILFAQLNVLLPLVAPVGAALLCSFSAILWQLGVEEKQRRWIRSVFGTYVSPQIVDEMIARKMTPQVGGVEAEITAFFSDIESFSPLAESLEPNRLVELMNEYLGDCTAAITKRDGTLDKYVGDAIIAIFGAPLACKDHAAAACHAALDFLQAQKALRERWAREEGRWPDRALQIRTRIGLNTGEAVVGNMGSHLRVNYTMMGDNVNLTQRIEAAAGVFGVQILTSTSTKNEASREDTNLEFRHIDRVLVPGRAGTVEVYELMGLRDVLPESALRCREIYEEGLSFYFRGEWDEAEKRFLQAAEFEERPSFPTPSLVMARRCEHFRESPPAADWNFAFQLTKGG